MNRLLIFSFLLFSSISYAQIDTLRVLFLGNSYTSVNNLPNITAELASVNGDYLHTDLNTPGGYTLEQHATNEISQQKIRKGNWDFVVLQDQSQIPTIEFHKENSMYPAARRLNDSIKKYNPCATTLFYMTWGRRFGGQQCDDSGANCSPDFIDFTHMQDSLESAYWGITHELNAQVAPVGIAWKKVITNNDTVLHASDDSHPNYSGSYLTACVFNSIFWNMNTSENSFIGNLDEEIALLLQSTADSIVFHSSSDWNLNVDQVKSDFSYEVFHDSVQFNNLSECIFPMEYDWYFDDGIFSSDTNPSHTYLTNQTYQVQLISQYCNSRDTTFHEVLIDVNTNLLAISAMENIIISPNPVQTQLNITFDTEAEYHIELLNNLGKMIRSLDTNLEKHIHIPTGNLNSGIYFIRISNDESKSISTHKVFKI